MFVAKKGKERKNVSAQRAMFASTQSNKRGKHNQYALRVCLLSAEISFGLLHYKPLTQAVFFERKTEWTK